jgi:hypothetical protein
VQGAAREKASNAALPARRVISMSNPPITAITFLTHLARRMYVCDCCGALYFAVLKDHPDFFETHGCNTCQQGKLKKLSEAL